MIVKKLKVPIMTSHLMLDCTDVKKRSRPIKACERLGKFFRSLTFVFIYSTKPKLSFDGVNVRSRINVSFDGQCIATRRSADCFFCPSSADTRAPVTCQSTCCFSSVAGEHPASFHWEMPVARRYDRQFASLIPSTIWQTICWWNVLYCNYNYFELTMQNWRSALLR